MVIDDAWTGVHEYKCLGYPKLDPGVSPHWSRFDRHNLKVVIGILIGLHAYPGPIARLAPNLAIELSPHGWETTKGLGNCPSEDLFRSLPTSSPVIAQEALKRKNRLTMALQNGELAACIDVHSIPESYIDDLDPEWVKLWNEHGRKQHRADEVSVEEYRKNPTAFSFTYPIWAGPDVFEVEDLKVPVTSPPGEVAIKVYTPQGSGPFPVHINYHGGGWVLGGLQSEAAWCRSVCNKLRIKVIDVDYRMAPEFIFPVAIHDSWDVVKWVRSHAAQLNVKANSLSIGGLSAGGHMSAVMSHMARDEGVALKLALMVVPSVDLRWAIAEEPLKSEVAAKYPSIALVENNPWGPRARMDWFMDYWIPKDKKGVREAAVNDWKASPILQTNFKDLPRTHIITAEYDLSRDESHLYGKILEKHGNKVTMKCYPGMPHAFGHYNHPERGLKQSHQYIDDTCEVIRSAHGL